MLKEDGATPADPFDMGAGRIDLSMAGQAGLVLDETEANYLAADPSIGGDPKTLNLASMGNSACELTCSWTRTVRSTLGGSMDWTASVVDPPGVTLSVIPNFFSLPGGATQEIMVTADVSGATPGEWLFGQVMLAPSGAAPDAHLPVAVKAAVPSPSEVGVVPRFSGPNDAVVYIVSVTGGSGLTIEGADPFGLSPDTVRLRSLQVNPALAFAASDVVFQGSGGCVVPLGSWVTDSANAIVFPGFQLGLVVVRTVDAGGGFPKNHIVKFSTPDGTINVRTVRGENTCVVGPAGLVEGSRLGAARTSRLETSP